MSGAFLWGKLPAHGDFVGRGLEADGRERLDDWLAGSLAAARSEGWEERWDAAPAWRFAWAVEGCWTAGALAPSADAVGRRYPLLVALTGLDAAEVEDAARLAEDLLYDALGGEWDADRLHAAALALAPAAAAAWTGGDGWWTLGSERFNEGRLDGARPAQVMAAMLTPGDQGRG